MADAAKFIVEFTIEGRGKQDLQEIEKLFRSITSAATGGGGKDGLSQGMESTHKSASEANREVGALREHLRSASASAFHMAEMFERVSHLGAGIMETGVGGLKMFSGALETVLHELSPVEQSLIRIMSTGKSKNEALHMLHQTAELMTVLPLTESQVSNLVSGLSVAHANFNKTFGQYDQLAKTGKASKEAAESISSIAKATTESKEAFDQFMSVNPVSLITDLAAAHGQIGSNFDEFIMMFNRGLASGDFSALVQSHRLPQVVMNELKKGVTQGAKGADKVIENVFNYLSKKGAIGMSQMAAQTLEGTLVKFKDLKMGFARALGMLPGEGGAYDKIVKGLNTIAAKFLGTFNNPRFQSALREGFAPIIDFVLKAMEKVGMVLDKIFTFIKDNPFIVKLALGFLFFASVLTVVMGAALAASAAFVGTMLVLIALPELLLAIPLAILMVVGAIAALVGGFLAFVAIKQAIDKNFGGINDFFEKMKLVIEGVRQAWDNWGADGTAITEELYQKMEKFGIGEAFLKILGWIRKAELWWDGFKVTFLSAWAEIKDTLGGAVGQIFDSLLRVFQALGGQIDEMTGSTDDATTSGLNWGVKVGNAAKVVAGIMVDLFGWINAIILATPDIFDGFSEVWHMLAGIVHYSKIFWNIIMMLGNQVDLFLVKPFQLLWDLLSGVVRMLAAFDEGGIAGVKREFGAMKDSMAQRMEDANKAAGRVDMYSANAAKLMNEGYDTGYEDRKAKIDSFRQKLLLAPGAGYSGSSDSAIPLPPAPPGPLYSSVPAAQLQSPTAASQFSTPVPPLNINIQHKSEVKMDGKTVASHIEQIKKEEVSAENHSSPAGALQSSYFNL